MRRRFNQLLNLYLDGAIDRRELIELKHLLEESVENQKEFQRQWRLQQAMKQVQRDWVLPESTDIQTMPWRISLGLVAMAAIAVFGSLLWLPSINNSFSLDEPQSLLSAKLAAHAPGSTKSTQNTLFFVDSGLETIPLLRSQQLEASQSLGLERNAIQQKLFLPEDWVLHPSERRHKSVVPEIPRNWHVEPLMQAEALLVEPDSQERPFVQPANFRFP